METRRQRLADSLLAQQLFRDVEDEEAWIREKEPVAASTNRGQYLFCGLKIVFNYFETKIIICFMKCRP